jgi:hypothetical protein
VIDTDLEHLGPALVDFVTDPRALAMPARTTIRDVGQVI